MQKSENKLSKSADFSKLFQNISVLFNTFLDFRKKHPALLFLHVGKSLKKSENIL